MAKNWKVGEAAKVIRQGKDLEGMQDIGKRFPMFAIYASQTNEAAQKLFDAIPEMISARQLETRLRGEGVEETEGEEAEEVVEPKATKPTPKAKAPVVEEEEAEAGEYDAMTTKELAALCKKRKITIKETYLTSKKYMIKKLEEADAADEDEEEEVPAPKAKAGKSKAKVEEVEEDEEEEPAPKAKAKGKAKPVVEEDEDEDEEEVPAPKAKSKGKAKPKADEDDDWDI